MSAVGELLKIKALTEVEEAYYDKKKYSGDHLVEVKGSRVTITFAAEGAPKVVAIRKGIAEPDSEDVTVNGQPVPGGKTGIEVKKQLTFDGSVHLQVSIRYSAEWKEGSTKHYVALRSKKTSIGLNL